MRTILIANLAVALLLAFAVGCASSTPPVASDDEFEAAVAKPAAFRAGLEASCELLPEIELRIQQAIQIGAPIYNAGSPLGCFRIYEGAAYKTLYELDGSCAELGAFLRAGLARAQAQGTPSDAAWVMRHSFNAILGERSRGRNFSF